MPETISTISQEFIALACNCFMLNKELKLSENIFSKKIVETPIRDGFGDGLLAAGEQDSRVIVLTADLKDSTRATDFAEKFPERFIECGVAEAAMVTVASGMANYGKIPFITSFAAFNPGRTWEQIRTTICINDVPVKIGGLFVGVSVGADGATHQMLEDIALMRSLPNMTVVAPADSIEARKAVIAAVSTNSPIYLRIPRVESPVFTTDNTPFEIGKAYTLWEEKNPEVTLIAHGVMVYKTLLAAKKLSSLGFNCCVLNCPTIKPLDEQSIIHSAKISGSVVVVEEHQKFGGLGSAVSEVLGKNLPIPIEIVAVEDRFGQSGKPDELWEEYGLTVEHIIELAKKAVKRKKD